MIAIGSDHGGYKLKEEIKRYLDEKEIYYKDFGTDSESRAEYPLIAKDVSKNTMVAINENEADIFNEINILRKMDHPNVLKIFEFYSEKNSFSMVTEICSGGELFQEIVDKGPFSEKYSAYVMYQIFSAINYCHNIHTVQDYFYFHQ